MFYDEQHLVCPSTSYKSQGGCAAKSFEYLQHYSSVKPRTHNNHLATTTMPLTAADTRAFHGSLGVLIGQPDLGEINFKVQVPAPA